MKTLNFHLKETSSQRLSLLTGTSGELKPKMTDVFSRWPVEPGLAAADPGVQEQQLPAWINKKDSFFPISAAWVISILVGILLLALLYLGLVAIAGSGSLARTLNHPTRGAVELCAIITFLSIAAASIALLILLFSLRRLEGYRQIHRELFDRNGISLWEEDWSAVGEAIAGMKRSGIQDMRAYFAANPEHERSLRKQVIVKDVNDFTVKMLGAPDKASFLGPLNRILPDTDQTFIEWLVAFAGNEKFFRSETHIIRPDGTAIDTLFSAALPTDARGFKTIIVTAVDITSFKTVQARLVEAETELARTSRVLTIGAMTASISHEMNSPLAVVVANGEASLNWLKRKDPNLPEAIIAISNIIDAATRAHEVISRTNKFLSNAPREMIEIDLVETARSSSLLIEREIRAFNICLRFDFGATLPPVLADPIQIQQVFVNLMLNAVQAMSNSEKSRDLNVSIHCHENQLRVAIRDQGEGIPDDRLPHIFDAFYSSKLNGMGMGLAICRSCIEAHAGRLWASSELGVGSTFYFTLPYSMSR